jgi:hypothetical protein
MMSEIKPRDWKDFRKIVLPVAFSGLVIVSSIIWSVALMAAALNLPRPDAPHAQTEIDVERAQSQIAIATAELDGPARIATAAAEKNKAFAEAALQFTDAKGKISKAGEKINAAAERIRAAAEQNRQNAAANYALRSWTFGTLLGLSLLVPLIVGGWVVRRARGWIVQQDHRYPGSRRGCSRRFV